MHAFILVLSGTILLCAQAVNAADSVQTRSGLLQVVNLDSRPLWGRNDTLVFAGKVFWREPDSHVSIEQHFKLSDRDIAVVAVNAGGSGTPDVFKVIVIRDGNQPEFLGDFVPIYATTSFKKIGDTVEINYVGREDNKKRRGRIDKNGMVTTPEK